MPCLNDYSHFVSGPRHLSPPAAPHDNLLWNVPHRRRDDRAVSLRTQQCHPSSPSPNHPTVAERTLLNQRRSLFNNTSFQCTFDDLPFVASALPGTVDRHNQQPYKPSFSICFDQPKIPIDEPPKLNDLELLLISTSRSVHRLLPPSHLPTLPTTFHLQATIPSAATCSTPSHAVHNW